MSFDARLEYSSATQHTEAGWCAVLIRDGEPWYLDGALVGMGDTPDTAMEELVGMCCWLVVHGENFCTGGPIPDTDREWLRQILRPINAQAYLSEKGAEA